MNLFAYLARRATAITLTSFLTLSVGLPAAQAQSSDDKPRRMAVRSIHVNPSPVTVELDEDSPLMKRVQLEAKNLPLEIAFKTVLTQAEVAFVLEPNLPDKKVTLTVKNVPLGMVLSLLAREGGVFLSYQTDDHNNTTVRISKEGRLSNRYASTLRPPLTTIPGSGITIAPVVPAEPIAPRVPFPPFPPFPPMPAMPPMPPLNDPESREDWKKHQKEWEAEREDLMKEWNKAVKEWEKAVKEWQKEVADWERQQGKTITRQNKKTFAVPRAVRGNNLNPKAQEDWEKAFREGFDREKWEKAFREGFDPEKWEKAFREGFDPEKWEKAFREGFDQAAVEALKNALSQPLPGNQAFPSEILEKRVSLNSRNAEIGDVLRSLLKRANVEALIEEDVPEAQCSFQFENVRLRTALNLICESVGVGWRLEQYLAPVSDQTTKSGQTRVSRLRIRIGKDIELSQEPVTIFHRDAVQSRYVPPYSE